MNGKKNGKEKPKIIETGDSFPIIDNERDIRDPERDLEKAGFKITSDGQVIGRYPKCPRCGAFLEKVKIGEQEIDLLDRRIGPKGKINYDEKSHIGEEIPKRIPAPIIPKARFPYMKITKYLLAVVAVVVVSVFAYKYLSREGQRLNFPIAITNFQETGGYFTIQGTVENNIAPVEARIVARFYDGFGKAVFVKKFPKQFFNTGVSPLFLSVKNHNGVSEVEVWIEK